MALTPGLPYVEAWTPSERAIGSDRMTLRNIAIWVFIILVVFGAYAVVSQQSNASSTHEIS